MKSAIDLARLVMPGARLRAPTAAWKLHRYCPRFVLVVVFDLPDQARHARPLATGGPRGSIHLIDGFDPFDGGTH
ncbi:hypothetical protein ACSEQ5_30165 [Pseudomonas aeruginosa]